MSLAKALKKIMENPDDLTELPQIIQQVQEQEKEIDSFQQKFVEMRELNKKYLSMVPVNTEDPAAEPEEKEPTLDDAKEAIINSLNEGGH